MPLVTIHAQTPWGPISFKTAENMAELLARDERPAEIIDVGERDPADVVREALRLMPPPFDATGQIPATVEKATNSVVEAVGRVPATHVADGPGKAAPGRDMSRGGSIALNGEAEPAIREQHVQAREVVPADNNVTTANDNIRPRIRRRPGAEVDAREIRTELGMSQPQFAKAFGLKLAVLRDWEQGRTKPEVAARVLLQVIEARPDVVRTVCGG